ncbi:uncharacterized protein PRCAT00006088001 [Priceomyces carsonii]|uniref:uncharacterized protein n=1 Tax=Priceomyces carsonii TaxID=28549 RepID=UPI002ED9A41D|nr:unnamed protein product [Priceomyces carsonii]
MSNKHAKYNLPRFRRISSHSVDIDTTRTVSSSSSSMISTPSNHIRRFRQNQDQIQGAQGQNHIRVPLQKQQIHRQQSQLLHFPVLGQNEQHQRHLGQHKPIKGSSLVRTKLLNLQGTRKRIVSDEHPNSSVQGFILHKPLNMNLYDYSVFTHYADGTDLQHGDNLPPAVKEAQIRAWESAEKVSYNLIFDELSDSSDDEEIIGDIPGYTRGEVSIILKKFGEKQVLDEEEEKKLLWEYRQKHQANQEKTFSQYLSLAGKRKIQISQKKDLLHRIFGYSNNINQEYMTNNSSYSTLDNVSSTQKAFHEDKDEINLLLAEDKAYKQSILEVKSNVFDIKLDESLDDFDYDKFQSITTNQLDKIYDDFLCGEEADTNVDIQSFAVSFLRKKVKEEAED